MQEHQTTHIMLTWADGRREQVRVPEDFPWRHYPEQLTLNGRTWQYVGTTAATPYYHELRGQEIPPGEQAMSFSGVKTPLEVPQDSEKRSAKSYAIDKEKGRE